MSSFRLLLWLSVALALATTTVLLMVSNTPSTHATGAASIGGRFTLTTHEGKVFRSADQTDKNLIIFFGFTHCPNVCPVTLTIITEALNRLGPKADRYLPLFITVDPKNDSSTVLKDFLRPFHPRFVGLTGTEEDIAAVIAQFKIYAERTGNEKSNMAHADYVFVMGKDGQYLRHFRADIGADALVTLLKQ